MPENLNLCENRHGVISVTISDLESVAQTGSLSPCIFRVTVGFFFFFFCSRGVGFFFFFFLLKKKEQGCEIV